MTAGPAWLTPDVDLAFVAAPSGIVHVDLPAVADDGRWRARLERAGLSPDDPATILMSLGHRETLCGRSGLVADCGGRWRGVHAFPDDRLCRRCMRLLGDKSVRAFDPDRPEKEPDDD